MREIKFRAWDLRNNKWFHQDLFIMTNAGFYPDFREFDDDQSLWDHEFDLMQYTGLTDKNGVEIYEGDIILRRYYSPMFKQNLETKMAIEWNERDTSFGLWKEKIQYVEVIGNIYENPELLEGAE